MQMAESHFVKKHNSKLDSSYKIVLQQNLYINSYWIDVFTWKYQIRCRKFTYQFEGKELAIQRFNEINEKISNYCSIKQPRIKIKQICIEEIF